MNKVDNKKAINKLAFSGIRANIKKYLVFIGAVILTTLLFTSLITVGGSMVKESQLGVMRQVGGDFHAGLKYLSLQEYEQVKNDTKVKAVCQKITVGTCAGEAFDKLYTEVAYYDELDAKGSFVYPEYGKLPEAENDLVTSDLVLEKLGIKPEIGAKVALDIQIGEEIISKEFILTGYFKGDIIATAQMALVSKTFQEKYAPTKTESCDKIGQGDYAGWISADIYFKNSLNIEGKTLELIERSGIRSNVDYGINWAYASTGVDTSLIVLGAILLVIFFISGYLIIYNIFDINIVSDMQEYGLLKTIGTTGKQLRKIVMRRAAMVSMVGIPIGLLLGVGVGALLLPTISNEFDTVNVGKGELHVNIWMLLGAALFSFLTVMISALRPCRKAAKVSPIETLRYSEDTNGNGKNNKKLLVVILSLSLALVIFNSVIGFIGGFNMDGYVKNLIVSDFSIQDSTLDNVSAHESLTESVTPELVEMIKEQPGVEAVSNIYLIRGYREFSDEGWKKIEENILGNEMVQTGLKNRYSTPDYPYDEYMKDIKEKKTIDGKTYGMGELAVEKLSVVKTIDGSDKIDWEKFNSGDYVLVTRYSDDDKNFINYAEPGDKVLIKSYDEKYKETETVELENGETVEYATFDNSPVKEYEVYGIVEIPYAIGIRVYSTFECNYILSEDSFIALNGNYNAMRTLVDVEDDKEAAFESWIRNYIDENNRNLDYDSKNTVVDSYKSFRDMMGIVGMVLAVILGAIGLMNFANTMVTSILVRSRELAMLEAVGMTGKQQKAKLMKEGFTYFIWTAVVSVLLSSILSVTVLRMLCDNVPLFDWNFTLIPLFASMPLICLMIISIPVIAHNKLQKKSVVDRLRVE